jgi:polysaccharide pyruvyl transferase WcaK-like protein
MLNLLITNHYSPNKGDCAILTAMIENIRRLDPDCTITVSSSHPNLTKKLNLEINNIIPWPIDYASGIRGYLRSSLYLVRTIAIGLLTKLRLTNLNALNYRLKMLS